ncbi:polysaccharide biosynthesis protein [Calderihabitans maritimus]|uniref:Polysaccharide biosynthesis protein CapD-like domain-containing protein n=1 Tax=Calderihabitans maritimus TaxID=1246530 RepID=A0A1Z5HV55_9FIRM|nr:nucleoside-diphosphate sugar epimerase/dehydratase [Calderihabitans maritimus]GAW93288.1 hypothetical protein KKC1_24250 [Calderihabitans maritimus]
MRLVREALFWVVRDVILINLAFLLATFFMSNGEMILVLLRTYLQVAWLVTGIILVFFLLFRVYQQRWYFPVWEELVSIGQAGSLSVLVLLAVNLVWWEGLLPVKLILLAGFLVVGSVGSTRLFGTCRNVHSRSKVRTGVKKVLIYSAGEPAARLAKGLLAGTPGVQPVGFIDDQEAAKTKVCGLPVLGGSEEIAVAAARYGAEEILVPWSEMNRQTASRLLPAIRSASVRMRLVPDLADIVNGRFHLEQIRHIPVDELLGRQPLKPDSQRACSYLQGSVVLVTGAGGSIGSELCRQVARFDPERLILLGRGENSIYEIELALKEKFPRLTPEPVIADVKNRDDLEKVFRKYRPQVVFHAAAHKHIPLMEKNPVEAFRNNVLGTLNVAEMADTYQAGIFVFISSDKAVNPASVMGATKYLAEMVIRRKAQSSKTRFVTVRFGNVLGSRGSVLPAFLRQIANGGPVTVTHPEMSRYFITIEEAVNLVIQAGAMAEGGETFVMDMGQPVKIMNLAEDLIRLCGYLPEKDIPIKITEPRPGEKLQEELFMPGEKPLSTSHPSIYQAHREGKETDILDRYIFRSGEGQLTEEEILQCLEEILSNRQNPA